MSSKCAPIRHLEVHFGIPTASWGCLGGLKGAKGCKDLLWEHLGRFSPARRWPKVAGSMVKYGMNSMPAKTLPRTKTKTQKCEHRITSTSYRNSPYLSDVRAASAAPGGGQKGPFGRPLGTLWAPLRQLLGAQFAIRIHAPFRSLSEPSFGRPRVGATSTSICVLPCYLDVAQICSSHSLRAKSELERAPLGGVVGLKMALKEAWWRVMKWREIW